MRELVIRIGRLLSHLEGLSLKISTLFVVLLVILINVEVFGRSFFSYSTEIADEYGGYLYAWIVLLGSVHLLRSDKYLTMTFLTDRMSDRARNAVAFIAGLIGLAVALISLWGCFSLVQQTYHFGTKSSQLSETPLVYPQLAMLIGYSMLALAYIEEIARRALGVPPRRSDDDVEKYGVGEIS